MGQLYSRNNVYIQRAIISAPVKKSIEAAILTSPLHSYCLRECSHDKFFTISETLGSTDDRDFGRIESFTDWLLKEVCDYINASPGRAVLIEDEIISPSDACIDRQDRPGMWVFNSRVFWPIFRDATPMDTGFAELVYSWRAGFGTLCFFTCVQSSLCSRGDRELSTDDLAFLGSHISRVIVDISHESYADWHFYQA